MNPEDPGVEAPPLTDSEAMEVFDNGCDRAEVCGISPLPPLCAGRRVQAAGATSPAARSRHRRPKRPARLGSPRGDRRGGIRLRLGRRGLGIRRGDVRAAAGGEGLLGRGGRVRAPLRGRRLRQVHLADPPLLLDAEAGDARHLPADRVQGHPDRLRVGRRRRQPGLREHALPRPARPSSRTRSGTAWPRTGTASCARTTTRRSGCSA